jgi:hypothetical protein
MVALGLEKVPSGQANAFYDEVRRLLPDGGLLRTGHERDPRAWRPS